MVLQYGIRNIPATIKRPPQINVSKFVSGTVTLNNRNAKTLSCCVKPIQHFTGVPHNIDIFSSFWLYLLSSFL
jgi:hypothetical protein